MSTRDAALTAEPPAPPPVSCRCRPLQNSSATLLSCRLCGVLLEQGGSEESGFPGYARSRISEVSAHERLDPGLVFVRLRENSIGASIYNPYFPHAIKRKRVLETMLTLCQQFGFTLSTYYKAIDYVNTIASTSEFDGRQTRLTAQVCVFLAAKTLESRRVLPSVNHYLFQTESPLNRAEFLEKEKSVVSLLDFHLDRTTPYAVYAYMAGLGLLRQSELPSPVVRSPENLKRIGEVENLCLLFLELCAQHYYFFQFPSHIVAGACIVQARNGLRLSAWPREFQELTGASVTDMARCIESITQLYRETKVEIVDRFARFLRCISGSFGLTQPGTVASVQESSLESVKCKNNQIKLTRSKKIAKATRKFASVEDTPVVAPPHSPPQNSPLNPVIGSAPTHPFFK